MIYDILANPLVLLGELAPDLLGLAAGFAADRFGPAAIRRFLPSLPGLIEGLGAGAEKFVGKKIGSAIPGAISGAGSIGSFIAAQSAVSSLFDKEKEARQVSEGVDGIDSPDQPTIDELGMFLEQNARAAIPNRESTQQMFSDAALRRAISQFIDDDVVVEDLVQRLRNKVIV